TLPQRIAHAIWNARLNDADCVLDLHCWTSTHSALAWGTAQSRAFVTAFGFPWFEIHDESAVQPGMLEAACLAHEIPCVVCELTPQDTVDPQMVDHGCRGILNLAKHLGIIEGDLEMPPVRYELGCEQSVSVVARKPGLVVAAHRPGDVIDKGESAAELIDLETLRCLQQAAPPERMILRSVGCTWGTGQLGYNVVRDGETIARFSGIVREFSDKDEG
ncbi:MAG: succinylglutamate desuccinylase/aspartoacylase family protein, partial [Armatimonadetes bacterium]|nr:succinylglutamate desuccinylase/aspartoacylase family protein [Armatimonadota bacterium]